MINWDSASRLHVINKIEEILARWFGVEVFYCDQHGKLRSMHFNKDFPIKSHLFKVQMSMTSGHTLLTEDLERLTETLKNSEDANVVLFESFFSNIYGLASKILIDGDYVGSVFVYPFIFDSATTKDLEGIVKKMIECGGSKMDIDNALKNMQKMKQNDQEYLSALVDVISEEIATYHKEIIRREEIIQELNSELGDKYRYHSMIGKSKKMQQIYRMLEKIAYSESSVLIQGENGTGKELVAKAIHYYSPRKDNVFLAINCSAFNDNLLDSELFGHVKGAFTGAVKDKKGLFEQAHRGTLFLDEIGDTSMTMQVKFLRVLQEGTYLPVGSTTSKKADVRIIAATNRNLKDMMENNLFREDLYYRINVININLPALRERIEDLNLLVDHFLQKRCQELGKPLKIITKKCLEKLFDYPWPGNVRELENEIERLVVLAGDEINITPDLLSPRILEFGKNTNNSDRGIKTTGSLKDALEELEALMIREGLKRCNFNKSKLAKELGISRASLIMKVEKYELDKRRKLGNE